MNDENDVLLEVSGLSIGKTSAPKAAPLVDSVSFQVRKGESLGLVGESGSGKSLTLRAIDGLLGRGLAVTGGSVSFCGEVVVDEKRNRVARHRGSGISMIFQEPAVALSPTMRVGDQIIDGLAERKGLRRREARRLAIELMVKVGISDPEERVHAYPVQLSGGMRQRVMIAAAIAQEPQLVLCDEPTTALDVTLQAQILELLIGMQRDLHLSMVYVTHDLAVVSQICTQLLVMQHGQIIERGPLQDIFDRPQADYTKRLLRAMPRI